ncbi:MULTISPECIES: MOSC domain-containing protein [unclassified Massilia]|uniref:MOSC domain-containing protein n=1 Tax=unclassified Massilia TaxID=2609279 RepID=UPI00178074CD|nr:MULTISPECIES: MOSC N-terminal beta barrel domain-containing protein [unclassified Massilia]MBD8529728.1 MOSC N-terminal beta barrel domain-containing protein [Massilia sp. CFBP 13647]MBD8673185.1 MOSC N-terminal beta barrel domain-containing protein [Massilia sp. CFBP 13721]
MPTLTHLILYPIKSCAAMPVDEAIATVSGLSALGVHDREWMLVTPDGQFLTQREFPRMATIVPRVDGDALVVSAPAMAPLRLPLAQAANRTLRVQIWDDLIDAIDCGDAASAWFGQVLHTTCRLVRFRPDAARPTSEKWTGGAPSAARFADAYPLLLIGQAALDDINARMFAAGRDALPMDRFRPNLVVDGTDPFEEDYTESFAADGIVIQPVKPCARCPIPAIDQATGIPGPDPLDILQSWRTKAVLDGAVCVGMNCIVADGAGRRLRRGQQLAVSLSF